MYSRGQIFVVLNGRALRARESERLVGKLDVRVSDLDTWCDITSSTVHVAEHNLHAACAHARRLTRTRVRERARQSLRDPVHVTRAHKRDRHSAGFG